VIEARLRCPVETMSSCEEAQMKFGTRARRTLPDRHRVDIWRVGLQQQPRYVERAFSLLSPEEIGSIDRVVEPHRTRRLLARASLRAVLSRYLGVSPADVDFTYGPHGKPLLAGRQSSPVEFNLSTTGDVCLIAVSRTGAVGIDVEEVAPLPDMGRIARRFFAAAEAAALGPGDGTDVRRFLRYWTAKEAYAKGLGAGLSLPLAQIAVPREFEHEERVTLMGAHGEPWSLIRVDPGSETVATLAANAPPEELTVVSEDLDRALTADPR
jgi:4'-phosphopantetheinyl transferase